MSLTATRTGSRPANCVIWLLHHTNRQHLMARFQNPQPLLRVRLGKVAGAKYAVWNEGSSHVRFSPPPSLWKIPQTPFLRYAKPSDSASRKNMAESDVSYPSDLRLTRAVARQACDGCRQRKAKCDTSTEPIPCSPDLDQPSHSRYTASKTRQCRRCAKFGFSCTYLLPSRVRGPQRKYA